MTYNIFVVVLQTVILYTLYMQALKFTLHL